MKRWITATLASAALLVPAGATGATGAADGPNGAKRPRAGEARGAPARGASDEEGGRAGGGVRRLSLEESVRVALRNSEEVAIAREGIRKAEGLIEEARAFALPQLSASASYDRLSGTGGLFPGAAELTSGGGGLIDVLLACPDIQAYLTANPEALQSPPVENYYQAGFTLTQVVYEGGKVRAGLAAARVARDQADVGRRLARVGVSYAVRLGYAGLLLRREFEAVAQRNLALARRSLDAVRSRRNAGVVTDFEVLQAEVEVGNASASAVKARAAADVAAIRFLRLVGLPQDGEVVLTDDLPGLIEGLSRDTGGSRELGHYLGTALGPGGKGGGSGGGRLDLRIAELTADLQKIALGVSTAGRRPSVAVQGSYFGANTEGFADGNFPFDWRVGLSVRVPIFDGLASRGRHAQALSDLSQAQLRRDALARDIESELRSALSRVGSAREFVASAGKSEGLAAEAVRQAESRYRNGLAEELVLDKARLGLALARTNLAEARHELYASMLALQRGAGMLRP